MASMITRTVIILYLFTSTKCQDSDVNKNLGESNYKEVVFTYPPHILSERDIPVCANEGDELIACNVVNKRYFYPPAIERLCRCPDRSECPWEFSDYKTVTKKDGVFKRIPDPNTIMLSSRAQFKFCNEVAGLPKCSRNANETALRVISSEFSVRRILTSCHCPPFKRWVPISDEVKEFSNGTSIHITSYSCDKLPRCDEGDLCGHVRKDTYSTYFLCSCPSKSWCYPRDMNEITQVTELSYTGPAIKAYCNRS